MKQLRLTLLVLAACLAFGCGDSDSERLERVYKKGYQEGFVKGRDQGTNETAIRYEMQRIWWGLIIGLAVGGGTVMLLTRRFIASEMAKFFRRREVGKMIKPIDVDLDPDIQKMVIGIATKKHRLENTLKRGDAKLVELAHNSVSLPLRAMDDGLVKLATLLQQLRDVRTDVNIDEPRSKQRLIELEASLVAASPENKEEIEEALKVDRRRLETAAQNLENITRCERKLATMGSFLDHMTMTVENLRTVEEQDAFQQFEEEVNREVKDLETIFNRTMSELLPSHKV